MSDINVFVTSSLTSSERRFARDWSLEHLKSRLEHITGIPPTSQKIIVYPSSNSPDFKELTPSQAVSIQQSLQPANDSSVTLDKFDFLRPFIRVHVEDLREDSELKQIANLTFGESGKDANSNNNDGNIDSVRFVYKDTDYQNRLDSVLKWKEQNKLGRFNPDFAQKQKQALDNNLSKATSIAVGSRCRITPSFADSPGDLERRGTVRYVGPVAEIAMSVPQFTWVGIELDEPLGKNDGSIKGHRYFECKTGYGSFVKPVNVEVGDFPVLDLFDDDDEEL